MSRRLYAYVTAVVLVTLSSAPASTASSSFFIYKTNPAGGACGATEQAQIVCNAATNDTEAGVRCCDNDGNGGESFWYAYILATSFKPTTKADRPLSRNLIHPSLPKTRRSLLLV